LDRWKNGEVKRRKNGRLEGCSGGRVMGWNLEGREGKGEGSRLGK